jgi:predicted metal-dependent hydrolase
MHQLALDLLGWAPSAPLAPPAPPAGAPDTAASHTHPRANRHVLLAGVLLEYELRRAHRRTIGFTIGPEGLTVNAPAWTAQTEIDAALHEKARWITTRLTQARQRAQRLAAARIDWRAGASVPYLGAAVILAANPRAPQKAGLLGGITLEPPATDPHSSVPSILRLPLPPHATPAQWRDTTAAWLTVQARRLFTARLDHYAPQLGVHWQRLSLSSAQTRWGSANSTGWIRLNWRLIHLSPSVINYVTVHELAHLREMNHGPRFWALVEGVLPDWAARRAALRDTVLPGF